MFISKLHSLLHKTPRWMSQSLLGHCQDTLSAVSRSSSIWRPRFYYVSRPLKEVGISRPTASAAAAAISSSSIRRILYGSQAFSLHHTAREMEPSETVLAKKLWEMNQKEAYCALYQPFVVAMAAGTLPVESFRNYIAQDVFYLAAFAEAYGLAVDNTDDEQAKAVLKDLQHHVQEELDQVHMSAVQTFGFQLPSKIVPNSTTTAYTEFLLAVAKGDLSSRWVPGIIESDSSSADGLTRRKKLAAFTIASLTPCMRLYAFLGQELQRVSSIPEIKPSRYVKWVETYASSGFEAPTIQSEILLHRLASPFSEENETVKSLYHRAMELEIAFFAAQTLRNEPIVPLLSSLSASKTHVILVSDFDLTCTLEDSCSVLAKLVLSEADGAAKSQHLETKWTDLGTQYSTEYRKLIDRILPSTEERSAEFNPHGLRQFLEEVSDFEGEANARVVQSEFLAGLSVESVKQAGSRIPFYRGCEELLTAVSKLEQSVDFHILSVCWSRTLIQSSFSSKGLEFANIHSNELQFSDSDLSDGGVDRRIESALDKERVFEKISSQGKQRNADSLSIYIGDSVTDLLCLLKADIGIVIGKSSSLDRVAAAFGIKMLPLYSGLLQREQQRSSSKGDTLWSKFEGTFTNFQVMRGN
ncbi:hypothetical protein R1sor_003287 [Riccia sorocarpa]|uniref:Thiaminase-2/PQQC domain-containing protein n=1 Tax=Riccia sorocarpa TaxID=122646 RepID=A0ABD3H4J1_9MARC